jgi:hypothetical protein
MRFILAAIFIWVASMSAASALPTVSPNAISVSNAGALVQAAKRNRPHSQRHSRGGGGIHHHRRSRDDGIHPLVGSGDY